VRKPRNPTGGAGDRHVRHLAPGSARGQRTSRGITGRAPRAGRPAASTEPGFRAGPRREAPIPERSRERARGARPSRTGGTAGEGARTKAANSPESGAAAGETRGTPAESSARARIGCAEDRAARARALGGKPSRRASSPTRAARMHRGLRPPDEDPPVAGQGHTEPAAVQPPGMGPSSRSPCSAACTTDVRAGRRDRGIRIGRPRRSAPRKRGRAPRPAPTT
jgi:hypothetical protein